MKRSFPLEEGVFDRVRDGNIWVLAAELFCGIIFWIELVNGSSERGSWLVRLASGVIESST
jgi:hypothetical protein